MKLKKNLTLNFEYDFDFHLFGIFSGLKDYRICYNLNKSLNIMLRRNKADILLKNINFENTISFSSYYFYDKKNELKWYLINNNSYALSDDFEKKGTIFENFESKNFKKFKLIKEKNNIDYFIQIHGLLNSNMKLKIINNIKMIDQIISIYEIDINRLNSRENLIIQ